MTAAVTNIDIRKVELGLSTLLSEGRGLYIRNINTVCSTFSVVTCVWILVFMNTLLFKRVRIVLFLRVYHLGSHWKDFHEI